MTSPRGAAQLERSVAWNLATGPFIVVGNLVLIPIAIAAVGSQSYGSWLLCFGMISIFAVADGGLGAGLIRQLALRRASGDRNAHDAVAAIGFRVFASLAIAFSIIVPLLIITYFNFINSKLPNTLLWTYAGLCSFGIFCTLLGRYFVAIQHSYGLYHPERIFAVIGIVTRAVVLAVAWWAWDSAILIASSEVVAIVITLFGSILVIRSQGLLAKGTILGATSKSQSRELYRQSIPSFISSFATLIAMNVPFYVVGATSSSDSTAIFGAITRLYTAARTILGWGCVPLLPAIASASSGGDSKLSSTSRFFFQRTVSICRALGLLIAVPLVAFPDLILRVWVHTSSVELAVALSLVGTAVFVHSRYAPSAVMATAIGRPSVTAWSNLLWLLTTVALSLVVVPFFGVVGAAISLVAPAAVALEIGTWRIARLASVRYARIACQSWATLIVSAALLQVARIVSFFSPIPLLLSGVFISGIWGIWLCTMFQAERNQPFSVPDPHDSPSLEPVHPKAGPTASALERS